MIFIKLLCILGAYGFKETPENQYFILSTSKFWFNMRQSVNSLMLYQVLKDNGVKDENILLLIPENTACNSKNNRPGIVCPYDNLIHPNVFKNVEVDYKQNDVSIKAWIDIWRGKYSKYTPQSKRLKLNGQKRFITYTNGHGGDGYMKMQDTSYILDFEMEKIVKEMDKLQMLQAFLISDSCSAITLYETLNTPNVLLLGSSSHGEKSYSHGKDSTLLISKTDRFSMANYEFFSNKNKANSKSTLSDLMKLYDPKVMNCNAKLINHLQSQKNESQILLSDYFYSTNDIPYAQQFNNLVFKERPQSGKDIFKWQLLKDWNITSSDQRLPRVEIQKEPLKLKKQSLIVQI